MFDVIQNGSEITIRLDGDMVAGRLAGLREKIHTLVQKHAVITLDFHQVNVIDSTMVGLLISTQNSLKVHGGKLILSGVSEDVVKILKIMRLDRHFEIVPR